jgi:hypothetical protein
VVVSNSSPWAYPVMRHKQLDGGSSRDSQERRRTGKEDIEGSSMVVTAE